MIEIRFRDIDPDTGGISQDEKIAETDLLMHATWISYALAQHGNDSPNREFYLVDLDDPNRELTYAERIAWFVANYYETGMEYEGLLVGMQTTNLVGFKWYDEIVSIPKTRRELGKVGTK